MRNINKDNRIIENSHTGPATQGSPACGVAFCVLTLLLMILGGM